jgi:ArsR family transcriptional regulator, arsenate/arsenite/antimonite-responsive transcriptional repressor
MNTTQAIAALGSLAQDTRLEVFRLLVRRGPEGLAAGAIAQRLDVPPATLTFHLHQLLHANLLVQRRESRSVIYAANFQGMNALMAFLTENCCSESACAAADRDADAHSPARPARRAAAR